MSTVASSSISSRALSIALLLTLGAVGCYRPLHPSATGEDSGALVTSARERSVGRNVLLIVADDYSAAEMSTAAAEMRAAITDPKVTVNILDQDADGIPDGLEDDDGDGVPDGATPTPALDRLAAAGVRFTRAWSAPLCSPTRASLFTGLYPSHHGVGAVVGGTTSLPALPIDVPTIAEVMKAEGVDYRTGLFGKWHLGFELGELPPDRGWDYFRGAVETSAAQEHPTHYAAEMMTYSAGTEPVTEAVAGYDAAVEVDDTLAWIETQEGPWWATVSLHSVHYPFERPPDGCGEAATLSDDPHDLFHLMISCMDAQIGRLIDGIPAEDLAITTIIFVGDNGTDPAVSQIYPVSRSKSTTFEGGVHVPVIIADGAAWLGEGPDGRIGSITQPGRVVGAPVDVVDLAALVGEVVGVELPDIDGVGLDGFLGAEDTTPVRSWGFSEKFSYDASDIQALDIDGDGVASEVRFQQLRDFPKKYRMAAFGDVALKLTYTGSVYQLYDLQRDPFEQNDVWCGEGDYRELGLRLMTELRVLDGSFPVSSCGS